MLADKEDTHPLTKTKKCIQLRQKSISTDTLRQVIFPAYLTRASNSLGNANNKFPGIMQLNPSTYALDAVVSTTLRKITNKPYSWAGPEYISPFPAHFNTNVTTLVIYIHIYILCGTVMAGCVPEEIYIHIQFIYISVFNSLLFYLNLSLR